MQTLLKILEEETSKAIEKVFGRRERADIAPCVMENMGHYQCNSALKLAKELKQNPHKIAQDIIAALDSNKMFAKVEAAKAGFINFTLSNQFLSGELNSMYADKYLAVAVAQNHPKTIVEFSSPNIAKELHVGHLRSTIIGDCLARLFEFLQHDVLRLNHVGDWGTQFGMLIAYLKDYQQDVLSGKKKADLVNLTHWYKAAKKLFDEDENFKKRAHSEVVKLQSHESSAIKTWQMICDISRVAFQEIYDLLKVEIKERGESFYNPYFDQMIKELEKKGLITVSDGAKCIFMEGFTNREGGPLPLMVQKSDGGFNYDTTDLAGFRHRCLDEKATRIIVVTDAGQSLHFQMVYKAAVLAGYLDPKKIIFDHVTFGLVLGPNGKKFRTREGETEKLVDLLKEAVNLAKNILKERMENAIEEELDKTALALGIDAVKYADLSCHRQKDYVFSYDRMLKFEGNTAAFLLYSYVRILSIKRNICGDVEKIIKESKIDVEHLSEIALGLHLRRFPEVIEMMERDLLPNRLADYLYVLAEKFNCFFRDCQVRRSQKEGQRLVLCDLTAKVLKQGLTILGLETVDRM
jgi:arginyl-tRNA synthetase